MGPVLAVKKLRAKANPVDAFSTLTQSKIILCWPLRSSSQASAGCVGPREGSARAVAGSAARLAIAVPTAPSRARKDRRTTEFNGTFDSLKLDSLIVVSSREGAV